MRFTVTGTHDGRPAVVSWEDGDLDGDASAIARIREAVAHEAVVWATPTGPHLPAALAPPAAVATIASVFDRVDSVDGDVPAGPSYEAIPAGATP